MDDSIKNIEMCEKATEIQREYYFRYRLAAIPSHAGYLADNVHNLLYRIKIGDTAIWLPRQDDLQGMLNLHHYEQLEKCWDFARGTEQQLRKWSEDPNRMLECIPCMIVKPPSYFQVTLGGVMSSPQSYVDKEVVVSMEEGRITKVTACPQCREYKGILPHIPGWSDLE